MANARVIDSWDRAQREHEQRIVIEKDQERVHAAIAAAAAAGTALREREAAAVRRQRSKDALDVVRQQLDEQAERRSLEEVRTCAVEFNGDEKPCISTLSVF